MSISCSRGWSAGRTSRVESAKRIGSVTCFNVRSAFESHTLLLDVQVWSNGMRAVVRGRGTSGSRERAAWNTPVPGTRRPLAFTSTR